MRKIRKNLLFISIFTFILVGTPALQSCKKGPSKSYKGKLKRGKPIPCPVKDC